MTAHEPDLVGRTSAELVGLGVPRQQRLDALHLLAVLDASVGLDGRVRRPLDDLADEFELPIGDVIRSLDHLERAGAIERDSRGVLLLGRDDDGIGGLQLAEFLEDVRTALDEGPAQPARPSVWPVRVSAGVLAAAAALAVLFLAPTQPAPTLQPTAAGDVTTTSAAEGEVADTPVADEPAPASPETRSAPLPAADPGGELAAASCPVGAPTIRAIGTAVEVVNPTDAAIVVTAITVAGTPVEIEPLTVGAGETVVHDVAVPPGLDATPSIDEWDWAAGAVDPDCA